MTRRRSRLLRGALGATFLLGAMAMTLTLQPPVAQAQQVAAPERLLFKDDGMTPNSRFPTLVYRGVKLAGDRASALEKLFAANGWPSRWRYTVYDFHHYHSNAHEVLGVASGTARLKLGGESGQEVTVSAGDVLVLPAGTGHRRLEASGDFLVVGGYPAGTGDYDLQRPDKATHAASVRRIAQVPLPEADPVTGKQGVLPMAWKP
ncbi:cupin domain-containing protein [Myxococcus sp. Y35]|uniref:cupin domain-containing protein n=1 Tax=Pseudomyxococcus flavus TaxID=3115648 RepID=UPI003CFAF29D